MKIRTLFSIVLLILTCAFYSHADVKCAIVQFSDETADKVSPDDDRLEAYIREAAGKGAKLIVAPENCLYRYDPWSQSGVTALDLAKKFDTLVDAFSKLAKELGVCIVFGLREPTGSSSQPTTYQSAVFLDNTGKLVKTYRKRVPSNSEKSFTKSGGNDWKSFETPVGKVFMQVCKDMDGDGYINSMPTDIDLLIGVNKDPDRGWVKVDAGCKKAKCYGIGANWAGAQGGSTGGNSGFVDNEGKMISEAGAGNYGKNQKIIYETLPLTMQNATPVAVARIPGKRATLPGSIAVYDLSGRYIAGINQTNRSGSANSAHAILLLKVNSSGHTSLKKFHTVAGH